uniref:Uncharacterized protein n=1 Tax=Romanomermis culicivorax TaxID=13658 RepID=A0A915K5S9_ROMCU
MKLKAPSTDTLYNKKCWCTTPSEDDIPQHCTNRTPIAHVSTAYRNQDYHNDFLKDIRCIVQISNTDDLCFARALVVARAYVNKKDQNAV